MRVEILWNYCSVNSITEQQKHDNDTLLRQKHDNDTLLRFAAHCQVPYLDFKEAVIDRMPEKTAEEIFYLLGTAKQLLPGVRYTEGDLIH